MRTRLTTTSIERSRITVRHTKKKRKREQETLKQGRGRGRIKGGSANVRRGCVWKRPWAWATTADSSLVPQFPIFWCCPGAEYHRPVRPDRRVSLWRGGWGTVEIYDLDIRWSNRPRLRGDLRVREVERQRSLYAKKLQFTCDVTRTPLCNRTSTEIPFLEGFCFIYLFIFSTVGEKTMEIGEFTEMALVGLHSFQFTLPTRRPTAKRALEVRTYSCFDSDCKAISTVGLDIMSLYIYIYNSWNLGW